MILRDLKKIKIIKFYQMLYSAHSICTSMFMFLFMGISLNSYAEDKEKEAMTYCKLGAMHGQLGNYQEAIEAFKQCIRLKPDLAEAHIGLGLAYDELGRYLEAIEPYKQTIRLEPNNAKAHYGLGVALLFLGDKQKAMEEYKILEKLDESLANELFVLINK